MASDKNETLIAKATRTFELLKQVDGLLKGLPQIESALEELRGLIPTVQEGSAGDSGNYIYSDGDTSSRNCVASMRMFGAGQDAQGRAFIRLLAYGSTALRTAYLPAVTEDADGVMTPALLRRLERLEREAIYEPLRKRLLAAGYSQEEAEAVLVANPELTSAEVELREGLRSIGYTPTECEECVEDVPDLSMEHIAMAHDLLAAYDPATTMWTRNTFDEWADMVVFPKLNTTALNGIIRALALPRLKYIPLLDTSNITTMTSPWGQLDIEEDAGRPQIRRLPQFDWSNLVSQRGLICGLPQLEILPRVIVPKVKSAAFLVGELHKMRKVDVDIDWEQVTYAEGMFRSTPIEELPVTDFPNATSLNQTFRGTQLEDLRGATINAPKCKDMLSCFDGLGPYAGRLKYGPQIIAASGVNMCSTFGYQEELRELPDYSHLEPSNLKYFLVWNYKIERVGGLNFAKVTTAFGNDSWVGCDKLAYIRIINLGQSSLTTYQLWRLSAWGSTPEGLESLVSSLVTDSYDRVAAGMPAATIQLHAKVKARLTAAQVAAITAKGFSITTVA